MWTFRLLVAQDRPQRPPHLQLRQLRRSLNVQTMLIRSLFKTTTFAFEGGAAIGGDVTHRVGTHPSLVSASPVGKIRTLVPHPRKKGSFTKKDGTVFLWPVRKRRLTVLLVEPPFCSAANGACIPDSARLSNFCIERSDAFIP
jgi:hypothetical protein